MTSKTIHYVAPINMTSLFIDSSIEWGKSKINTLLFEVEEDKIVLAYDNIFSWAEGKPVKEIEQWIATKEKEQIERQKKVREDFLTKQQQDILLYEEEKKKQRIIDENNYPDLEVWVDGKEYK